jgi:O-antigen/teichoic acid export membrane protein
VLTKVSKFLAGSLVAKVATAITGLLLIRWMPPAAYADFIYVFALGMLGYSFVGPALNRIFIIEGEKLGIKSAGDLLAVQIIMACTVAITMLPFALFGGLNVWLALGFCLSRIGSDFVRNQFLRDKKYLHASIADSFRALASFLIIVLAMQVGLIEQPATVILAYVASDLLLVLLYCALTRIPIPTPTIRHAKVIYTIVQANTKFVFLFTILLNVTSQAEIFILKLIGEAYNLAVFGAAQKYYGLLVMVITSINAVYLPEIAKIKSNIEIKALYRAHWRVVALIAPVIAVIGATSYMWIPFLDGGKYPESILVFWILCCSALVSLAFAPYSHILLKSGKYDLVFKNLLKQTALLLPLRCILIFTLGPSGAATSLLLTHGSLNFWYFRTSKKLKISS